MYIEHAKILLVTICQFYNLKIILYCVIEVSRFFITNTNTHTYYLLVRDTHI